MTSEGPAPVPVVVISGPADVTIADDGTRTPAELATALLRRLGWSEPPPT